MHNDNALHAALHWSRRRFLRVVGTSVAAVPLFSACSGAPTTPTPGPEAAQSPPSPRWPLTLNTAAGTMLLYEPQLDTWNGHALTARLAVAVQGTGQERTFGVIWISAQSTVDKDTRLVTLNHPTITQVNFPSAPAKAEAYKQALQEQLQPMVRTVELDRLEEQLKIMQARVTTEALPLQNAPPRLFISPVPALLVHVGGAPVYRPEPGTPLQRVLNTRVLLLKDASGRHYLRVFDGWLTAPALAGDYVVAAPSPSVQTELEHALKRAQANGLDLLEGTVPKQNGQPPPPPPSLQTGPVPKIYVATEPAELLVIDGTPNYTPLQGTNLLYVSNTTGQIFKRTVDQKTYVLLSGRWYAAPSLEGPWTFVPGAQLPPDFAQIPDDSPKENVKASVPGTVQAQEALIANSLPQTAVVTISQAQLTPPQYDGAPQLQPIAGTPLHYVVNSSLPVIQVSPTSYFAVENGVWFTATALPGPWVVATAVPSVIYTIPPSSPLHYVTYVYVYGATPDTVYVGYTPGYYGTCVSAGVVVYGTGYVYDPWIGVYYYPPPPPTAMAPAWRTRRGRAGTSALALAGPGAPPRWAGAGAPIRTGGRMRGRRMAPTSGHTAARRCGGQAVGPAPPATSITAGAATTAVTRQTGGFNAWTGNAWRTQSGMSYNSLTGRVSAGQRGVVQNVYTGNYAAGSRYGTYNPETGRGVVAGRGTVGNVSTGQSASGSYVRTADGGVARVNGDVYAGHDGQVYRRTDSGSWEHYANGSWNGVDASRASQGEGRSAFTGSGADSHNFTSTGRTDRASLDREWGTRFGGANRAENFHAAGGGFGGGRFGGGFGRRR